MKSINEKRRFQIDIAFIISGLVVCFVLLYFVADLIYDMTQVFGHPGTDYYFPGLAFGILCVVGGIGLFILHDRVTEWYSE